MATVTLAQLRVRVLRAADMKNTRVVPGVGDTTELDGYINDGLSELHDLLVLSFENYLRQVATIDIKSGTELYPLPDNFYKEMALWYLCAGDRLPLRRISVGDIPRYQHAYMLPTTPGECLGYDIVGDEQLGNCLLLAPAPSGAGTLELWYVPTCRELVGDNDVISYAIPPGMEEYAVVDAAMRCREKVDLPTDKLAARKGAMLKRIEIVAKDRSLSHPRKVVDVHARSSYWRRRML